MVMATFLLINDIYFKSKTTRYQNGRITAYLTFGGLYAPTAVILSQRKNGGSGLIIFLRASQHCFSHLCLRSRTPVSGDSQHSTSCILYLVSCIYTFCVSKVFCIVLVQSKVALVAKNIGIFISFAVESATLR